MSGRRLQNHGGIVHPKGLITAPLPSWLHPLLKRLADEMGGEEKLGEKLQEKLQRLQENLDLFQGGDPNHVLVNAYAPGEGIMVSAERLPMQQTLSCCMAPADYVL